jgi:hypothetical protein
MTQVCKIFVHVLLHVLFMFFQGLRHSRPPPSPASRCQRGRPAGAQTTLVCNLPGCVIIVLFFSCLQSARC